MTRGVAEAHPSMWSHNEQSADIVQALDDLFTEAGISSPDVDSDYPLPGISSDWMASPYLSWLHWDPKACADKIYSIAKEMAQ